MNANIGLSQQAASKVAFLMDEEGNQNLKLRVFITGGGCSGFSYGFTFDDGAAELRSRSIEIDRGRSKSIQVGR